jgi:hypothetical protein
MASGFLRIGIYLVELFALAFTKKKDRIELLFGVFLYAKTSSPKLSGWWKSRRPPISAQAPQCGCEERSAHL